MTLNENTIRLSGFDDSKELLTTVFERVKKEMGDDHSDDYLKMVLCQPHLLEQYLEKYESLKASGEITEIPSKEESPCGKTEQEAILKISENAKRRSEFAYRYSGLREYVDDVLLVGMSSDNYESLKTIYSSYRSYFKILEEEVGIQKLISNAKLFLSVISQIEGVDLSAHIPEEITSSYFTPKGCSIGTKGPVYFSTDDKARYKEMFLKLIAGVIPKIPEEKIEFFMSLELQNYAMFVGKDYEAVNPSPYAQQPRSNHKPIKDCRGRMKLTQVNGFTLPTDALIDEFSRKDLDELKYLLQYPRQSRLYANFADSWPHLSSEQILFIINLYKNSDFDTVKYSSRISHLASMFGDEIKNINFDFLNALSGTDFFELLPNDFITLQKKGAYEMGQILITRRAAARISDDELL